MLRGLTILVMTFVNASIYLHDVAGAEIPSVFLHTSWTGFSLADAVFPGFVVITGMSMALALDGTGRFGGRAAATRKLLWRAVKLFALGVLVSNLDLIRGNAEADTGVRIMGVLQRLGLVSLCVGVSMIYQNPTWRLVTAFAILCFYGFLLLVPPPDGGFDLALPGRDLPAWIDRRLLPGLLYVNGPRGYDPEGIASTLPAIAQGLIGALLVGPLRSAGALRQGRFPAMLAVILLLGGFLLGLVEPVCKSLWSPAFVLVSTAVALLAALGVIHTERTGGLPERAMRRIFLPVGEGAILAYLLQEFCDAYLDDVPFDLTAGHGSLAILVAILFTALIWAATDVAGRLGIVLRV